jgi:hypothetical protein
MKKMNLKCVLVICLIAVFSCNKVPSETVASSGKTTEGPICGSVKTPVDTAAKWVQNYDLVWTKLFGTDSPPIKAYTIRSQDLLEAMGMPAATPCSFDHVRAYIGLDAENKFRLFFTPVVGADLCNGNGGRDTLLIDPAGNSQGQYVLDLNTPCPNVCASNPIFETLPQSSKK